MQRPDDQPDSTQIFLSQIDYSSITEPMLRQYQYFNVALIRIS
jgi:hypothetical protein